MSIDPPDSTRTAPPDPANAEPAWPLEARFRFFATNYTADVSDAHGHPRFVLRRSGLLASDITIEDAGGLRVLDTRGERGADYAQDFVLRGVVGPLGALRLAYGTSERWRFTDPRGGAHRLESSFLARSITARRSNGVPLLRLQRRNWTLQPRYRLDALPASTYAERVQLLPPLLVVMMVEELMRGSKDV